MRELLQGDGRVRELVEYMEPGLVPSGTFREPPTEASATLEKKRVLATNRLDPRDTQTQAVPPRYSHIITPTCVCGNNSQAETKENRVFSKREHEHANCVEPLNVFKPSACLLRALVFGTVPWAPKDLVQTMPLTLTLVSLLSYDTPEKKNTTL